MTSESGQAEIVANIFTAIKNYKERLESKAKPQDQTEQAPKAF